MPDFRPRHPYGQPYRLKTVAVRSMMSMLLGAGVLLQLPAGAQAVTSGEDLGSCTLKDHVYTCDSAAFAKALAHASTVFVETRNVDSVSRAQLKELLTKKYGKTLAEPGSQTDLIFLIVPVGVDGINISPGDVPLGTLRVYSAGPDGSRSHLLWAETYNGQQDLPWPAVVRALLLQFQKHFRPS